MWDASYEANPPPFQSYIGHASGITQLKFSDLQDGVVNVVSVGAGNGVFLWKFYGVEEYLQDSNGTDEECKAEDGGSASETYRQHRTKRIASSPVARAEKAASTALAEKEEPLTNVLGEDAQARMFQSALAQIVSTVQRRGQMIGKFVAKLANIFSDIDSVNDGYVSGRDV